MPPSGVQAVDVVELGVVLVDAHQDVVGEVLVDVVQPGLDIVERGEVAGLAGGQVDVVQPPVLVAAGVLLVDDVLVVVGPEVRADAPVAVRGDGNPHPAGDGAHPHVEDAGVGGDPRQAGPVGGDAGTDPLGVAEQHLAGDDRNGRMRVGHPPRITDRGRPKTPAMGGRASVPDRFGL